eukprot:201088-Prorocentrum_minimum.AAC.1
MSSDMINMRELLRVLETPCIHHPEPGARRGGLLAQDAARRKRVGATCGVRRAAGVLLPTGDGLRGARHVRAGDPQGRRCAAPNVNHVPLASPCAPNVDRTRAAVALARRSGAS